MSLFKSALSLGMQNSMVQGGEICIRNYPVFWKRNSSLFSKFKVKETFAMIKRDGKEKDFFQ